MSDEKQQLSHRQMADIHMHIIPGVDDGSYDLSTSEIMVIMAYTQGIRTIFATPHSSAFLYDPPRVVAQFHALQERLASLPLDLRLYLGCEVRCHRRTMHNILSALENGTLPSLNGTRYVLTEFKTSVLPEAAIHMTEQLIRNGWLPVIAHVERYPALFDGHAIPALTEMGCLLQINSYSLVKEEKEAVSARARQLLTEGLVTFLGSDAHRLDHRPPDVRDGLDYLYDHCDAPYADAVAFGNARRLLEPAGRHPNRQRPALCR